LCTKVTIVPVGINYFQGHRFRSRVFVDIGAPYIPNPDLVAAYRDGSREERRAACDTLLAKISISCKAVTVEAPDYNCLQFFRAMRRLYVEKRRGATT
jgi:glycerol-3-phosphate O-acyltransferase/dihydroxyacetone phosphate acyltransferase